jgi:hypothetical protein
LRSSSAGDPNSAICPASSTITRSLHTIISLNTATATSKRTCP